MFKLHQFLLCSNTVTNVFIVNCHLNLCLFLWKRFFVTIIKSNYMNTFILSTYCHIKLAPVYTSTPVVIPRVLSIAEIILIITDI